MITQETLDFLSGLKQNNNKEWFQENKRRYKQALENVTETVDELILILAAMDASYENIPAKDSLFRIYRDTRFSKDKSPYKTNFGAFLSPQGKHSLGGGFYLHIEPGESFFGGGIYCPEIKVLNKVREHIVQHSERFTDIVTNQEFKKRFREIYGEKLKTAPKGFPKDHPQIEYLRYKSYTVLEKLSDKDLLSKKFYDKAKDSFAAMQPLNQFVDEAM